MNIKDLFRIFKESALKDFNFLISDYGFNLVSSDIFTTEYSMSFRNKTTGVYLLYELGGVPGVGISKLGTKGSKVVDVERYSIDQLIRKWCPKNVVERNYKFGDFGSEQIKAIMDTYSQILKTYGKNVLKGNFSIFKELKTHKRND